MPTPPRKPERVSDEEIEHRFGYHRATFPSDYDPASPDRPLSELRGRLDSSGNRATAADHAAVREVYRQTAKALVRIVPPGREQALMLTELQASAMWANAGVAMESPLVVED